MVRVVVSASVVMACLAGLVGCSGHDASVGDNSGTSDQKLQTKKDGSPTGDGNSCSWEDTTAYDTCGSKSSPPTYKLGEEFPSVDGCNECACTTRGIMCTVRACGGSSVPPSPPIACDAALRLCKDGSPAKPLPDSCQQVCPEDYGTGGGAGCPAIARICKDGSPAKLDPSSCALLCPEDALPTEPPKACTAEALKCPDGSYVSRTGPNCEFAPCPGKKY